jgi:hypothetical protein
MEFVFLTCPEIEGAAIRWDQAAVKSPELVAAALSASFSDWEVRESPLGCWRRTSHLALSACSAVGHMR